MAVKRRKDSAAYQADFQVAGERVRKDFPFTAGDEASDRAAYEAAVQYEADARVKAAAGLTPKGERAQPRTLGELKTRVVDLHWKGTKGEQTTVNNAADVVTILGPNTPIEEVKEDAIDVLVLTLKKRGVASSTINRKLSALSKMLTHASERGYITRKPKIKMLPEYEGRTRYLQDGEEARITGSFNHMDKEDMADLAMFLVDTGARLGNALHLPWTDIDNGAVRLWMTKGNKAYSVPLTQRLKDMLARRKDETRQEGPFTHLSQSAVSYAWGRMKVHVGLEHDEQFVPHCLRHTFISRLVQRGVPIATVKELAGHATITMTMRYAHLAPKNYTEAVKVLEQPEAPALKIA